MTTPGFSAPAGTRATWAPGLPTGAAAPAPEVGDRTAELRRPVDPAVFVNRYTRPVPHWAETFSGPGYAGRPPRTSGLAVAALVCGVVGVFLLVPALGAIGFGHAGLVVTADNDRAGRGLAIGGLVLGYAVAAVVALVVLATWVAGL